MPESRSPPEEEPLREGQRAALDPGEPRAAPLRLQPELEIVDHGPGLFHLPLELDPARRLRQERQASPAQAGRALPEVGRAHAGGWPAVAPPGPRVARLSGRPGEPAPEVGDLGGRRPPGTPPRGSTARPAGSRGRRPPGPRRPRPRTRSRRRFQGRPSSTRRPRAAIPSGRASDPGAGAAGRPLSTRCSSLRRSIPGRSGASSWPAPRAAALAPGRTRGAPPPRPG